ncbi:MAG TPA: hypothetical protein VFJ57_08700 [Solirubrobacterales bacterium]|nr:hypothetical protein [Solirubrobacterales bacterium]
MGSGRLSLVVGLAVAALLLAATGSGEAELRHAGKFEVQKANTVGVLFLGRERGYRIALSMPNERIAIFYAIRAEKAEGSDGLSFSYSAYVARNLGNLGHGVVRARFGSMGRVSLRFRPGGLVRKRDPQPGCEGAAETTEYGRFAGHLSFHGEGNYFHVSSAGGRAALDHEPRLRCEKGQAEEPSPRSLRRYVTPVPLSADDESIALLYAFTHSHGRYIGITAAHPEGSPPGAVVQLAVVEPRRGMVIGHGVYLEGPPGTLLTSQPGAHPATATLAPPAPFYGKASYSEESRAWTGNLGISSAGLNLPLIGPDFRVHLCVVNPLRDRDGCEFFTREPPPDERPASLGRALR